MKSARAGKHAKIGLLQGPSRPEVHAATGSKADVRKPIQVGKRFKIGCLGAVAVVVALMVVVAIVGSMHDSGKTPWDAQSALQPHLAEYLAAGGSGASKNAKPYIVGKAVLVDLKERDFATLGAWVDMPAQLRPATPAEVGTVVQVSADPEQVGEYRPSGGGSVTGVAYRYKVTVTIIDLARRRVIATKKFLGSDPPERVLVQEGESTSDGYGDMAEDGVLRWLESLPIKHKR